MKFRFAKAILDALLSLVATFFVVLYLISVMRASFLTSAKIGSDLTTFFHLFIGHFLGLGLRALIWLYPMLFVSLILFRVLNESFSAFKESRLFVFTFISMLTLLCFLIEVVFWNFEWNLLRALTAIVINLVTVWMATTFMEKMTD